MPWITGVHRRGLTLHGRRLHGQTCLFVKTELIVIVIVCFFFKQICISIYRGPLLDIGLPQVALKVAGFAWMWKANAGDLVLWHRLKEAYVLLKRLTEWWRHSWNYGLNVKQNLFFYVPECRLVIQIRFSG